MRLSPFLFTAVLFSAAHGETRNQSLDRIAAREDMAESRAAFVKQSLKEAEKPIITRPESLGELLEKYQWSMKYKTKPAHQAKLSDDEWERFALSLSDANINGSISERLPRLAAAYHFSKDPRLSRFILAQLTEMSSWTPLERPGTTGMKLNLTYAPWLGTGWGIRGITECISLMPAETIPPDLRTTITANLETEIKGIRQAWAEKKFWNTREVNAHSNQWVVPMEGIVLASIFTGIDSHRDDYEFGVKNLLKSLDAQGKNGEFAEGVSYAGLTMNSLLSAAEAAADLGDRRLIDHPYLKKFPTWYAHHLQPGGNLINAFDSKGQDLDSALLSRFVSALKSPEALWVIRRNQKNGFGAKLPGLIGRASANFEPKQPPLFGTYDFAARINWRSSWDDNTAAGFWMRGGHSTDSHDHQDRGHISFSIGERKILIEAGILSYGIPEHPTHYRSVAGHNVLQIGNAPPKELTPAILKTAGQILNPEHRSAPITVDRMDASGGSASVDASACYGMAESWIRHVTWDKSGVDVRDEVILKSPDYITFRWHLSASPDAPVEMKAGRLLIDGTELIYEADSPVTATIEPMPAYDALLKKSADHACVVIRSTEPVKTLSLQSKIAAKP